MTRKHYPSTRKVVPLAPHTSGFMHDPGRGEQGAQHYPPQQLVKKPSRPPSSVFVKGTCKYLSAISICVDFHPGLGGTGRGCQKASDSQQHLKHLLEKLSNVNKQRNKCQACSWGPGSLQELPQTRGTEKPRRSQRVPTSTLLTSLNSSKMHS